MGSGQARDKDLRMNIDSDYAQSKIITEMHLLRQLSIDDCKRLLHLALLSGTISPHTDLKKKALTV